MGSISMRLKPKALMASRALRETPDVTRGRNSKRDRTSRRLEASTSKPARYSSRSMNVAQTEAALGELDEPCASGTMLAAMAPGGRGDSEPGEPCASRTELAAMTPERLSAHKRRRKDDNRRRLGVASI